MSPGDLTWQGCREGTDICQLREELPLSPSPSRDPRAEGRILEGPSLPCPVCCAPPYPSRPNTAMLGHPALLLSAGGGPTEGAGGWKPAPQPSPPPGSAQDSWRGSLPTRGSRTVEVREEAKFPTGGREPGCEQGSHRGRAGLVAGFGSLTLK